MYSRGIEFVSSTIGNGQMKLASNWFEVPTVGVEAGRAGTIVPGSIIVQCVAASNALVDAAVTADTTGTASRLILGICMQIVDSTGKPLKNQMLTTTDGGYITILPARGNIFRCLEDGVGGVIATGDYLDYVSFVVGTPTSTSTSNTDTPNPEANIAIDSSNVGGTLSNRAFQMLGLDASTYNATTTGRKSFKGKFTDAFTTVID